MKKKLCVLTDFSKKNFNAVNKETLEGFFKELNYLYIIDVSKIFNKSINQNIPEINNNFEIFQPSNLNELNQLFLKNNFIIYYCLNYKFKYFKVNLILIKNKVEKFFISNLGYNPENFNYEKNNIFRKINIFIKLRLKNYIIRVLAVLNLWPKIEYFFESSSYIIKSIDKSISKKIEKKFGIKLSFYLKVIKINSRPFDNLFYLKSDILENYIVFIDGMIFDHKDRIMREGSINEIDRAKYYKDLNEFLLKLKKFYNKEIIICLHPKNYISDKKNDFKNFRCVKFETEKMISEAFIVLFHEGSSIIQAVYLKKKIINLHGKYLGNYINKRSKLYSDALSLKRIDLENYNIEDKELLLKELNGSIENYQNYIENNIVNDSSKSGVQQIIQYLNLK